MGGSVSLVGVTIAHNNSGEGGGLFKSGGGSDTFTTATLTNSTVSNNNATTGGGISNFGNLILRSVTVTANTATDLVAELPTEVGCRRTTTDRSSSRTRSLRVTRPRARTPMYAVCMARTLYRSRRRGTTFIGLLGTGVDDPIGVNGDIVGTIASPINALLGPLQDNAGPTLTHALLVGSPAIDAGNNFGVPVTDLAPRAEDD